MQTIYRRLLIGAGFTALATIGSFMNRSSTGALHAADGGPSVTIGGPLPLPTTAAQSGAWNVGINGTPTVGISGTPSVNAAQNGVWNVGIAGTPNVNVNNHVAVRNIDEKGRIPYMEGGFRTCPPTPPSALCDMVFAPVPAGKRLVVERVSANIGVNPGSAINGIFLLAPGVVFSLAGRSLATPQIMGVNDQVLTYYEAGQTPDFRIAWSSATDTGSATAVISGYLVDLSQ